MIDVVVRGDESDDSSEGCFDDPETEAEAIEQRTSIRSLMSLFQEERIGSPQAHGGEKLRDSVTRA